MIRSRASWAGGKNPGTGDRRPTPIAPAAYALVQFLLAPALGALSDRFGRRPVLLLALLGMGIDYSVLAAAPTPAWLGCALLPIFNPVRSFPLPPFQYSQFNCNDRPA